MSRLAALDMARRRFTMDSRPGQSPSKRQSIVSARARAASGAYGLAELAKSLRSAGTTPAASDDSDSDDGGAGGEGSALASIGEASEASPATARQNGNGSDGSPSKREMLRRRLSTTTSFTRPSEIPGNRAIRLVRKVKECHGDH